MIQMNVSGHLTADAIVKNINGTEVINFTVASSNRYKNKAGEVKEEVVFMPCQLWNNTAAANVLNKGRGITVYGLFKVRNYIDKDGILRNAFSVRVISFQVFGKKQTEQHTLPALTNEQSHSADIPPTEHVDDLPF